MFSRCKRNFGVTKTEVDMSGMLRRALMGEVTFDVKQRVSFAGKQRGNNCFEFAVFSFLVYSRFSLSRTSWGFLDTVSGKAF